MTGKVLIALQAARELRDLAPQIGFTAKGLAYLLHGRRGAAVYRTFDIPKKSGGVRTIAAPDAALASAQRNLGELLARCWAELLEAGPPRKPLSHGFHHGLSIVTNGRDHTRRRYVLNLDLADFFGTINFGRVRGFFIADRRFALDPNVATVIAQIACHEDALPQGAPSSPIISNLIGHILDQRLVKLAKTNRVRYSRYADDITFSTNEATFPASLACQAGSTRVWTLAGPLRDTIERAGFAVNDGKTRMQIKGSRQTVTGLVVNEKVNVAAEYYRDTRAMCHALFKTGAYHKPDEPTKSITSLAPLEGRLAHIMYVRHRRDLAHIEAKSATKAGTLPGHVGSDALYRRFLFYKHFVAAPRPTIVTEGKTDIIYMKSAIKSLAARFPEMVSEGKKGPVAAVSFIPASYTIVKILSLLNGYRGMKGVIGRYRNDLRKYPHTPCQSPAIFVFDNDKGGQEVFGSLQDSTGAKIDFLTPQTWHHLFDNVYILRTPPKGGAATLPSAMTAMTAMEDLFPAAVLSTRLDGKIFDRNDTMSPAVSYGKAIFADKVVRPGTATIDFSGFVPLLDGLVQIIAHHRRAYAPPAASIAVRLA